MWLACPLTPPSHGYHHSAQPSLGTDSRLRPKSASLAPSPRVHSSSNEPNPSYTRTCVCVCVCVRVCVCARAWMATTRSGHTHAPAPLPQSQDRLSPHPAAPPPQHLAQSRQDSLRSVLPTRSATLHSLGWGLGWGRQRQECTRHPQIDRPLAAPAQSTHRPAQAQRAGRWWQQSGPTSPRARAALSCPEHSLRAQIRRCTPAGAAAFIGELPRRSTLHWPVSISSCKSWQHPFRRWGCLSERTALHGGSHGCGTVLGQHGGDLCANAHVQVLKMSVFCLSTCSAIKHVDLCSGYRAGRQRIIRPANSTCCAQNVRLVESFPASPARAGGAAAAPS